MRVNTRRSSSILIAGTQFIDSIKPGLHSTSIKLLFGCDIGKLLSHNIVSLRLSAYDRKVSIETQPFTITTIGDSLISASREDAEEKERITNIRENFRILMSNIDITSFISNSDSKAVQKSHGVDYDVVATLDSKVIQAENKLIPSSKLVVDRFTSTKEFRRLVATGIDPLTVSASFPISRPESSAKRETKSSKLPRSYPNKIILAEIKKSQDLYARNVGSSSVYKRGTFTSKYHEVFTTIVIPNNVLLNLNLIYFYIEALNENGIAIGTLGREVSTNEIANDIRRMRRDGSQTKMSRVVPPPRSEFYTEYKKVDELNDNFVKNLRGDPIITRTIKGNSFIGRVIKRVSINRGKSEGGLDIIPFFPQRNGDYLEIKIRNVPENIIALSLQRRRPTHHDDFINIGDEIHLTNEGFSVTFVDTTLVDDTHYEYRLRFVDNRSNIRFSANKVPYHFVSTNLSDAITATITSIDTNPVKDRNADAPRFSLSVLSAAKDKGVEYIRKLMSTIGVPEATIQSAIDSPENYSKFVVYEVIRYNLRTGDIDSLGVQFEQNFTDDSALSETTKYSVTPLNFFDNYRYVLKFGLRAPSSLIPTQTNPIIDPRTGLPYAFNSYKFKSRRLSTNLPSNAEMTKTLRGSVETNIDLLSIGVEVYADFSADKYQPKIYDLNLRKTYVNSNLLSWKLDGDLGIVDHFQVYALADGVEALIGCAHPFSKFGMYQYEDFELYNRVGTVTYRVTPILTNFTASTGDTKISITRKSNLPDFLQEKDAN